MIRQPQKNPSNRIKTNVASPLVGGAIAHRSKRLKTWRKSKSVRLPEFDYKSHVPYHIIVCTRNRQQPFEDQTLAEMVCEQVVGTCDRVNACLGAFCLMPDHLHMLISPDENRLCLSDIVGQFKGKITNLSWALGWKG